ncbi:large ribosomal subunit protein eL28-like [Clytia hemisphaerica]|uniref:Large ribosomal subunit protein eL28 n=1 Tax=Clytia hemisphaerica TaxID=252671 RepID=A0A7M5WTA9_9CNID
MSADLCWSIVRKNSCFLVKSLGKTLTKEPNNLSGVNNFASNGYINKKTVGVDADPSGKGVVLSIRKSKNGNKPAKSVSRTTVRGSRHSIKVIRDTLNKSEYRKDLSDIAIRRASAIIRSQNTSAAKKQRSRRKKN